MPDIFVKCIEGTRCLTEYCYNAVYKADNNGIIRIPDGPYQKHHLGKLHIDGYRVIDDQLWLQKHGYIPGTINEIIEKKIDKGEIIKKDEELVVIKPKKKIHQQKQGKRFGDGRQCEHFFDNGKRCGCMPVKGSVFCRHHQPKKMMKKYDEESKKVKKGRGRPRKNLKLDEDIPF
jgi:hypothetical protein